MHFTLTEVVILDESLTKAQDIAILSSFFSRFAGSLLLLCLLLHGAKALELSYVEEAFLAKVLGLVVVQRQLTAGLFEIA